jgi:hypothetical protein
LLTKSLTIVLYSSLNPYISISFKIKFKKKIKKLGKIKRK